MNEKIERGARRRACRPVASAVLLAASLLSAHAGAQPAPSELVLFSGPPLPAWRIAVGGPDTPPQPLVGEAVSAPMPDLPYLKHSEASLRRSGKAGQRDALTLRWKQTWYAGLRIEAAVPVDLHPYLAEGTLEFDVNVIELSKGGVDVSMQCGADCYRKVSLLGAGRAIAGKGWRHLALSMSCFVRQGEAFDRVPTPFALDAGGSGELAVANVRFVRRGQANTGCPDYRTAAVTPSPLDDAYWAIDTWMPRHEQKLGELRAMKAAGHSPQLVFIGDSITEGWEKSGAPVWDQFYQRRDALALGFGGDRTENVLWRLQHGEIDGIAPKVAVLMIGTNNSGRQDEPEATAAGIKRILDELRQRLPTSKVLLLAVFPREAQPGAVLRKRNERINAIIAGFADGERVHFLDIGAALLAPDGTLARELMPDLLHPNAAGYAIWARSMAPTLEQLMAQ